MQDVTSIGNRPAGFVPPLESEPAPSPRPAERAAAGSAPGADRVELSAEALQAEARTEALTQEQRRIQTIRAEIAAGTYLTPGKLAAVVDLLHAELTERS